MYFLALEPRSVEKHFMNWIFIVSNFLFCAKPVRLLHVYQPMLFILGFGMFSLAYQKASGMAIYPILDWYNLGPTIGYVVGLGFIGIPVIHAAFFGLYRLRVYVSSKCCSRHSAESHKNQMGNGDTEMAKY